MPRLSPIPLPEILYAVFRARQQERETAGEPKKRRKHILTGRYAERDVVKRLRWCSSRGYVEFAVEPEDAWLTERGERVLVEEGLIAQADCVYTKWREEGNGG